MRRPYLAANWKMNKTIAETEAFCSELLPKLGEEVSADVVLCVPFTDLAAAVQACWGSPVRVAAQNMHEEASGDEPDAAGTPNGAAQVDGGLVVDLARGWVVESWATFRLDGVTGSGAPVRVVVTQRLRAY